MIFIKYDILEIFFGISRLVPIKDPFGDRPSIQRYPPAFL